MMAVINVSEDKFSNKWYADLTINVRHLKPWYLLANKGGSMLMSCKSFIATKHQRKHLNYLI